MRDLFGGVYEGKRVLVTGHTGFKGSWLSLWLTELGAEVAGFSLPAPTDPSHWSILGLGIEETIGDIRDAASIAEAVARFKPEVVFHLAAQPLVRESYRIPADTFSTNVVGSINVYEACRAAGTVRALVSITTDKVYRNNEWEWGYRENDPFGGHDPYSASKACAEIATDSYRSSFWNPAEFGRGHGTLLATARAGNVVGGGDWAADRLIPDLMRAASSGASARIRNPDSTRPWQHVLEPLAGYLMLGRRLLEGDTSFAEGWNLGPDEDGVVTVAEVVERMKGAWSRIDVEFRPDPGAPHEARLLKLDCAKAKARLGWKPVWDGLETVEVTAAWYRSWIEEGVVSSRRDIERYVRDATSRRVRGLRG
ncbi:MAG: CDP-glucose 4,6-dehydratase [Fibrobacteria bacterium]|nr:CDP-glucose 4,6-dehydratase [Fibrobacteria bacterium]